MFHGCSSLKSIDLSSFNTTNVNGIYNLKTIIIDDMEKTGLLSEIKDKKAALTEIKIFSNGKRIKFDYKYKSNEKGEIKVRLIFNKLLTSTSCMFFCCSSLKSIDLSSFNTSNVKDMICMFKYCSSLKSIDLSSFNTSNVNNMSYMFMNCSSLKLIDLSSFNTSNVNDMSGIK